MSGDLLVSNEGICCNYTLLVNYVKYFYKVKNNKNIIDTRSMHFVCLDPVIFRITS